MKIYVAGKNLERARLVMNMLRDCGHHITYDWATNFRSNKPQEKSFKEREGVRDADLLVYLWESDQESARYEAGMAMGLGKPIIVSGKSGSFFFHLPEVHCVNSDESIVGYIKTKISADRPTETLQ